MKKNIAKLFVLMMTFSSLAIPMESYANTKEPTTETEQNLTVNSVNPRSVNVDISYAVKSAKPAGTVADSKEILLYDGSSYPSTRDGETVSVGSSVSYSHTYSGSLQTSLAKTIQAQIGYTFGDEETFQAYKTSAPLKKGEYCKGYYKKKYKKTDVMQVKYIHTYGYETVGGMSRPVDRVESHEYPLTCKEAILPDIKITYHKARNARSDNNQDTMFAEETYEFVNGEYKLAERIEY